MHGLVVRIYASRSPVPGSDLGSGHTVTISDLQGQGDGACRVMSDFSMEF